MAERLLYVGKPTTNKQVLLHLHEQGYEMVQCAALRPALEALTGPGVDLLIIDTSDTTAINLHRISHAAGRTRTAPFIILLLNNHGSIAKDARYDEFLARPFTPRRLAGLVRKLLDGRRDYVLRLGPLTLDRRTQLVMAPKGLIHLTPKQFQLLDYLLQHAGTLLTRKQIMQEVWDTTYLGDTRTLDVHIRWLRESIEADPDDAHFIRTFRGRGYCLDIEGPVQRGGAPLLSLPVARG